MVSKGCCKEVGMGGWWLELLLALLLLVRFKLLEVFG